MSTMWTAFGQSWIFAIGTLVGASVGLEGTAGFTAGLTSLTLVAALVSCGYWFGRRER